MAEKINKLFNDNLFQHYYYKTYHRTDYASFTDFNDQTKVSFLINLFLYITNQDDDKIHKKQQYNSCYSMISNEEINKSDIMKLQLSKLLQKHHLPEAKLFYDEMFDRQLKNDIKGLMWFSSQINQHSAHPYMKINYDQIKEENNNVFQLNNKMSIFLLDNCHEAKIHLGSTLIKSKKNDIQLTDKIIFSNKISTIPMNYSQLSSQYNQLNLKNNKIDFHKEQSNFYLDEISQRGFLLFNKKVKSKKMSNQNYLILNQSYSDSSIALAHKYGKNGTLNKLFECPINSYVILDYNEAVGIIQLLLNENNLQQLSSQKNKYNEQLIEKNKILEVNKHPLGFNYNNTLIDNINDLKQQIEDIYKDKSSTNDIELLEEVRLEIRNKYHQLSL